MLQIFLYAPYQTREMPLHLYEVKFRNRPVRADSCANSNSESENLMPLPAMKTAKRCRARTKSTGRQCENPAAFGMAVCRLHGARKRDTVRRGKEHPNYKDGKETLEAKKRSAEMQRELKQLEIWMKKRNII